MNDEAHILKVYEKDILKLAMDSGAVVTGKVCKVTKFNNIYELETFCNKILELTQTYNHPNKSETYDNQSESSMNEQTCEDLLDKLL